MNKNAFVNGVVIGGGFILLCAAPRLALAQSVPPPASMPPAASLRQPVKSPPGPRRYISPSEFLAGLTLTEDQKAKINQIREDTKSRLAAVGNDPKLGPEVKDAMITGFQRIENSRIFEVLTTDQQQQVRRRIAILRAAAQQPQGPSEQPPVPYRNPQPK